MGSRAASQASPRWGVLGAGRDRAPSSTVRMLSHRFPAILDLFLITKRGPDAQHPAIGAQPGRSIPFYPSLSVWLPLTSLAWSRGGFVGWIINLRSVAASLYPWESGNPQEMLEPALDIPPKMPTSFMWHLRCPHPAVEIPPKMPTSFSLATKYLNLTSPQCEVLPNFRVSLHPASLDWWDAHGCGSNLPFQHQVARPRRPFPSSPLTIVRRPWPWVFITPPFRWGFVHTPHPGWAVLASSFPHFPVYGARSWPLLRDLRKIPFILPGKKKTAGWDGSSKSIRPPKFGKYGSGQDAP